MPKRILDHRYSIAGHITFWLISVCLMLFFFYFNEKRVHFDLAILLKTSISNIGFAMGVYLNLYVLIPRFLKQKNYIFYVFWLVVLLTLSSIFVQLLLVYPLRDFLKINTKLTFFDANLHSAYFFATLIYVAVTSFLKFVKEWLAMQDLKLKIAEIEKQKLEAELKTLKGQLNPHFLFNSLNNIYSLSLTKSDLVPDLILKLSDLMRHIIYESKENFIALEKEVEFARNFIALQKIRTPEFVTITTTFNGKIPYAKVIPLLFEPFIDNAFKHGLPNSNESDFIRIIFDFNTSGYLVFKIFNNYEEPMHKSRKNSGIGIENIKQRLKYMYKPDDYSLLIKKENQIFSIFLQIKLK